jgi:hypothetical protein
LPLRADLIAFLRQEKAGGRRIELVSAADSAEAERVAARVGLFDSVHATSGALNLKGARKAAFLAARHPAGFVYAGDSPADVAVWRAARAIILAGAEPATARAARALNKPIVAEFPDPPAGAPAWLSLLAPLGWAIYLTAILPWFLALFGQPHWWNLALTLVALGAGDIAGAVLARLQQIPADRADPNRRDRPLASGAIPVHEAMLAAGVAALIALAAGLVVAWVCALMAFAVATIRRHEVLSAGARGWMARSGLAVCALIAGAVGL